VNNLILCERENTKRKAIGLYPVLTVRGHTVLRLLCLAAGDMGSTIVGTYGYMAPEQFTGQVRG
jgi:serine/threonine protein kinase